MKRILTWLNLLLVIGGSSALCQGQQLDPQAVLYTDGTVYGRGVNGLSKGGLPIDPNVDGGLEADGGKAYNGGAPKGSDAASQKQFQSVLGFNALVVPRTDSSADLAGGVIAGASKLGLPHGGNYVLRAAQVGGATFFRAATLNFGSVIAPPVTDENGNDLSQDQVGTYWISQPYTNSVHYPGAGYYYSPNADAVFALDGGTIVVCWQAALGQKDLPPGEEGKDYVSADDRYYALYPQTYIIGGGTAKDPRRLYWSEQSFAQANYMTQVPDGAVGAFQFVYTAAFPEEVPEDAWYDDGYQQPLPTSDGGDPVLLKELRTVWYDAQSKTLRSYNKEGRLFAEVLGDLQPSGTRTFLGFEILDVRRTVSPADLTCYLGDRIAAYADGTPDDDLEPRPVTGGNATDYLAGDGSQLLSPRTDYYAVAPNPNPSDVRVWWLETGVGGIQWLKQYDRYACVWPANPLLYTQFLRPAMPTADSGINSAVIIPGGNLPALVLDDSNDLTRSFLKDQSTETGNYLFYTFVNQQQPQLRTLLSYTSSAGFLAYERVLSTLSTSLRFTSQNPAGNTGAAGTGQNTSGGLVLPGRDSALRLQADEDNPGEYGYGYGSLTNSWTDTGAFTIETWVKLGAYPNAENSPISLVSLSGVDGTTVKVTVNAQGFPGLSLTTTSSTTQPATSTSFLAKKVWYHLAAVYTGGILQLWINGEQVGAISGIKTLMNSPTLQVGSTTFADAWLDSLRIWSTAMDDTALQAAMETGAYAANTGNLRAQFTFDETGATALDSSGNSNDMKLYNGAASNYPDTQETLRYVAKTVTVGERINPPAGELGADGRNYLAGWVNTNLGTFYSVTAYVDPVLNGFDAANLGSIIPVNTVPDNNQLEVWWLRSGLSNDILNEDNGFLPTYWPQVIGSYTVQWPAVDAGDEIILASNLGTGLLPGLQANATVYYQNDPGLPGYNPNEEHALVSGGVGYALRDDLNLSAEETNPSKDLVLGENYSSEPFVLLEYTDDDGRPSILDGSYSSEPFVLLEYTDDDGRPSMRPFRVLRDKPEAGIVFDYLAPAGKMIQPPMPLPLLPAPVATDEDGVVVNYNKEVDPSNSGSEWPIWWDTDNRSNIVWFTHSLSFEMDNNSSASASNLDKAVDFNQDGSPNLNTDADVTMKNYADSNKWESAIMLAGVEGGNSLLLPVRISINIALDNLAWSIVALSGWSDSKQKWVGIKNYSSAKRTSINELVSFGPDEKGVYYGQYKLTIQYWLGPNEYHSAKVKNFQIESWVFADQVSPYLTFTYLDRKQSLWAMRGPNEGLPKLEAGQYQYDVSSGTVSSSTLGLGQTNYVGGSFNPILTGGGAVGEASTNYIHTSRPVEALVTTVSPETPLPDGIRFGAVPGGLAVYGTWPAANGGPYYLTLTDGDGETASVTFTHDKNKDLVPALNLNNFPGRPPGLATAASGTNAFAMEFYYLNQPELGFYWPESGATNQPSGGEPVPYLRPYSGTVEYTGEGDAHDTPGLPIIYRPYWPADAPTMDRGETLTVASNGRPAIRGQSSVNVLYQQSIALTRMDAAVLLQDPTRIKRYDLVGHGGGGLAEIPGGVYTSMKGTKLYFPNLPPHLADRFYFDPDASAHGSLIFKGQFVEDISDPYLQLNVLSEGDLETLIALCPGEETDAEKIEWVEAIENMGASVDVYIEDPNVPGQWIVGPSATSTSTSTSTKVLEIVSDNTPVDSYALTAAGPGTGFVSLIFGNGSAFTDSSEPISMSVLRVTDELYPGVVKVLYDANPLSDQVSYMHTADLAGQTAEYEYEWKIAAPVDGFPPVVDAAMSRYLPLAKGEDLRTYNIADAGVASLSDNWLVMRYRSEGEAEWSGWSAPAFSEGYIKRAMNGITPFNQRVADLTANTVSTSVSILTQAGTRYEGDIALDADELNNYGLIEIYETILNQSRDLSITGVPPINYGPANDALLLAAGNISDLYNLVGDEAASDADNPTIGVGSSDPAYGSIASSLFSFDGVVPSLLEEEMALLQGRDDVSLPGVTTRPVYNRLVWNYTGGISSGQPIYALNYNILDKDADGVVDAHDAAILYPQGHGDAYGHYLTGLMGYHSLLMNEYFDWVPTSEAVDVLGLAVSVNYQHERKFAASAANVARTGRELFDLAWRKYFVADPAHGWEDFGNTRVSSRTVMDGTEEVPVIRNWGPDQWASRTGQGILLNWVVGNAILPAVDPDPDHEGIQKVDRTTVRELGDLALTLTALQADMDAAEAHMNPLGVSPGSLPFDLNPAQVTGPNPKTHFEQVYERAVATLNNAVVAFDDAKGVTEQMRLDEGTLQELDLALQQQELGYNNRLIDIYGSPYPDDMGPGVTYVQDYDGPDLYHWMYVELPQLKMGELDPYSEHDHTFYIDIQGFPEDWTYGTALKPGKFDFYGDFYNGVTDGEYNNSVDGIKNYIPYDLEALRYTGKPKKWTSRRVSPGQLQQAISALHDAQNSLHEALDTHLIKDTIAHKQWAAFNAWFDNINAILGVQIGIEAAQAGIEIAEAKHGNQIVNAIYMQTKEDWLRTLSSTMGNLWTPQSLSVTLGNLAPVAVAGADGSIALTKTELDDSLKKFEAHVKLYTIIVQEAFKLASTATKEILEMNIEGREKANELEDAILEVQETLPGINGALEKLEAAQLRVDQLAAQGQRIISERTLAREQAAGKLSTASTRNVALRLFRNEKLERYKTLFDLAARYAYLAAEAYDYETGLLGTDAGQSYLANIVSSRALGVVQNGQPQFGGGTMGDAGLSSALAEMKADFDVLKGRLGFNNPYAVSTDASLRTGDKRIPPHTDNYSSGQYGHNPDDDWSNYLAATRMDNILDDADVARYCQQVRPEGTQPVPGLVIPFSTSIHPGKNLFGNDLQGGDSAYNSSYFATKLFAAGVVLEGYKGMSLPGSTGSSDPDTAFLDPNALSGTPYVYLIPVGQDIMRTPALGDASNLREWNVDDMAIPLPFNIGQSTDSTAEYYQAADSLTEPLYAIRKHPAFRAVDSLDVFPESIWGPSGLLLSEYASTRLIGRSVWNTRWKLVIPGDTLLADPEEGLAKFINTVRDIRLHFVTYSYSGN